MKAGCTDSKLLDMKTAGIEGAIAYREGMPFDQNPIPYGCSNERRSWEKGWKSAEWHAIQRSAA